VTLTATNAGGSNTVTKDGYITVSDPQVTVTATTVREMTAVTLTAVPVASDTLVATTPQAQGSPPQADGSPGTFPLIWIVAGIAVSVVSIVLYLRSSGVHHKRRKGEL
jgi:PKD repeat protein